MNIEKARVSVHKDTFSMEVGLSKVDQEQRLVHGFATLDNLDLQGDVVDFDASVKAFERSRKNVREMHQPIAVGKIVNWEPKDYVTPDGEMYKGIYVSVYVSRGAQATWEKVLDGTLSAFSISGPVRKSVVEMRKGSDKPARRITDYDLTELSLVDSGGNQHSNVIAIQKNADGVDEVTGIATDVSVENVFWCETDQLARLTDKEHETCPNGHDMASIGWIETGDPDSADKLVEILKSKTHTNDEDNEGGVNTVSDTVNTEEVQATAPAEVQAEEVAIEAPAEETPAATEVSTEEVATEAPDESEEWEKINKAVSDLESKVDQSLEAQRTTLTEAIERLEKSIIESKEESVTKLNDIQSRYDEVKTSLESISSKFEEVSKSLEVLEGETAIKKSNDLGGSEVSQAPAKQGIWGGAILSD